MIIQWLLVPLVFSIIAEADFSLVFVSPTLQVEDICKIGSLVFMEVCSPLGGILAGGTYSLSQSWQDEPK
ncbi:hypothetical protein RDI58_026631 [Solanum bulbocastanum]|uniref:Uncharacterized protein n=1 Tax=Solanum bulbocastanum TaxID=147425 RepID=A0AAN8Y116_SOLBU